MKAGQSSEQIMSYPFWEEPPRLEPVAGELRS